MKNYFLKYFLICWFFAIFGAAIVQQIHKRDYITIKKSSDSHPTVQYLNVKMK